MITSGTRLGVYEVTAALGSGGMGEVYRARDSRLGRDVALKLLPSAFGHDAERLARFEREAQLLAALNHPNIGAIYGLEAAQNLHFLVLELVEGETLATRIIGPHAYFFDFAVRPLIGAAGVDASIYARFLLVAHRR